jgi:UDP-3-O-[3-hydroxymyristoyl] glucosamine N-acyltransferase
MHDVELTLGELAERTGARLVGDAQARISGVSGIREAEAGQITFVANPRYLHYLAETQASAVIVGEGVEGSRIPCLVAADPYRAYLEVLQIFARTPDQPPTGIDPTAIVSPKATLGENLAIGPHVVIEDEVEIGDGTILMAGCYVGPRSRIGAHCRFYPNVVLREETMVGDRVILHPGVVLGSDGFGYAFDGSAHRKIPQMGRVIVEDEVEIGANSTIDRATTGETRIGRGTKIDNLVHVAHNVEIGELSIICAQAGISGSTRLGRGVTLAGQAGLVGHIEIGDGARVGAQGGVTKSVPAGETVSGYPATNHGRASRMYAALRHLPEALRAMRELEARVQELERAQSSAPLAARDSRRGDSATEASRSGERDSGSRGRDRGSEAPIP